MAHLQGDFITVTQATKIAGVGGTLLRRELKKHLDPATGKSEGGRLSGYLLHERTWMVRRQDVEAMARSLGWKAGKPRQAKKSPSKKAKPKKAR